MFTGLVEGLGRVAQIVTTPHGVRLWVAPLAFSCGAVSLGESVAINGCCLTVAEKDESAGYLAFDLLEQTLRVTSLGDFAENSTVNMERALAAGQRFGGHFLQGHVDTTGLIHGWEQVKGDWRLEVRWKPEEGGLVLPKGSIAIDGISLTAAETGAGFVICWIIPHTRAVTNLAGKQVGQRVNLEFDMLGKYVQACLAAQLGTYQVDPPMG